MRNRLNLRLCPDSRSRWLPTAMSQSFELIMHTRCGIRVSYNHSMSLQLPWISVCYTKLNQHSGDYSCTQRKPPNYRQIGVDSFDRQYWEINIKEMHTLAIDFGSSIIYEMCSAKHIVNIWPKIQFKAKITWIQSVWLMRMNRRTSSMFLWKLILSNASWILKLVNVWVCQVLYHHFQTIYLIGVNIAFGYRM